MKKAIVSAQKIVEATTGVEAYKAHMETIFEDGLTRGEFVQKTNKNVSCHRFQITEKEWMDFTVIFFNVKRKDLFKDHLIKYITTDVPQFKTLTMETRVDLIKNNLEGKHNWEKECDEWGIGLSIWRKAYEEAIEWGETSLEFFRVVSDAQEAVNNLKPGVPFLGSLHEAEKYGHPRGSQYYKLFTDLFMCYVRSFKITCDVNGIITNIEK